MQTFQFQSMRQISKNRFLGIIRDEDHYKGPDRIRSRPRIKEVIFCSFGVFMIIDKYLDENTKCHVLKLRRLTRNSNPKTKKVNYIILDLQTAMVFDGEYFLNPK